MRLSAEFLYFGGQRLNIHRRSDESLFGRSDDSLDGVLCRSRRYAEVNARRAVVFLNARSNEPRVPVGAETFDERRARCKVRRGNYDKSVRE